MKQLALGLGLALLLTACGSTGVTLDPSGTYSGTMTATFGGTGTINVFMRVTAGSQSGYAAVLTTQTSSVTLYCEDLRSYTLECIGVDASLDTLKFVGPVTPTGWAGTFDFTDFSAGGGVVLAGDFDLSRR